VVYIAHLISVYRQARGKAPKLRFHNIVYDATLNQLELIVENLSTRSAYIRPSFRLIHLLSPDEWKTQTVENGIPMASGRESSLIKGYDLLGECEDAVSLSANSIEKLIIPLQDDAGIKPYDNIRVDANVGFSDAKLRDSSHSTLRVKVVESEVLDLALGLEDDNIFEDELFADLDDVVDDVVEASSEAPAETLSDRIRKSSFPLEATCICCGRDKWLNWVVDGTHVCQDCRNFLENKIVEDSPGILAEPAPAAGSTADLLLSTLNSAGKTLTASELADAVGKSPSSVRAQLKKLQAKKLVSRRKAKGGAKFGIKKPSPPKKSSGKKKSGGRKAKGRKKK